MSTLELLHHYTTETCRTMVEEDPYISYSTLHRVYRVVAPKMGLSFPYLMHSILALAALHLHSHSEDPTPAEEYYSLSCYHVRQANQQSVLPICPDGTCPPGHTCTQRASALFLAKFFLSMHTLMDVVSTHGKQLPSLLDSLVDWIQEQRMISTFFFNDHPIKLFTGPLAEMFNTPQDCLETMNQAFGPPLSPSLLSLHKSGSGAPDDSELSDRDVRDTYITAISHLETCYRMFHVGFRMRALLTWASLVSNDLVQLLREKRPRALILLAHFCSLFQDLDEQWSGQVEPSCAPSHLHVQMAYEDILDEKKIYWWVKDVNNIVEVIRSAMPDERWREFLDVTLSEGRALKGL